MIRKRQIPQKVALPRSEDERGSFIKFFSTSSSDLKGFEVKQTNFVTTKFEYTFRGLHYQKDDKSEAKLFRLMKGKVLLICFCIDPRNIHFKQSFEFILDTIDHAILVPRGYATGYLTLANDTELLYFSDNSYAPDYELGVRFDDKTLDFSYIDKVIVISEKDKNWTDFDG